MKRHELLIESAPECYHLNSQYMKFLEVLLFWCFLFFLFVLPTLVVLFNVGLIGRLLFRILGCGMVLFTLVTVLIFGIKLALAEIKR